MTQKISDFIKTCMSQVLPIEMIAMMERTAVNEEAVKKTTHSLSQLGLFTRRITLNDGFNTDIIVEKRGKVVGEPAILVIGIMEVRHNDGKINMLTKLNNKASDYRFGLHHPIIRQWLRGLSKFEPEAAKLLTSVQGFTPTIAAVEKPEPQKPGPHSHFELKDGASAVLNPGADTPPAA